MISDTREEAMISDWECDVSVIRRLETLCLEETGQQPRSDCPLYDECGRYVLFEAGHYGEAWVSFHSSPAEAGEYVDGQEYGEDWEAVCLLDQASGSLFRPRTTWDA